MNSVWAVSIAGPGPLLKPIYSCRQFHDSSRKQVPPCLTPTITPKTQTPSHSNFSLSKKTLVGLDSSSSCKPLNSLNPSLSLSPMKTISGKVVSSKPTSLSKAAKVLATFVSAETGASQAVKAYLRRSSAAFTELNQLHRELRSSRSECKSKNHHRPGPNLNLDSNREQSFGESKKKNKRGESSNVDDNGENLSEVQDAEREVQDAEREVDDSVVEKRKKRKSGAEEGGIDGSEERHRSKKKKRRQSEEDD